MKELETCSSLSLCRAVKQSINYVSPDDRADVIHQTYESSSLQHNTVTHTGAIRCGMFVAIYVF